jgi:peptidyl-prolyl cis-trans isomerase B (cyclophilin B)
MIGTLFSTLVLIGALMSDTQPQYIISVRQGNHDMGKIRIQLWPSVAPKHCAFFEARVSEGWYNGSAFHRIVPGFVIQGGDPNSKDKPKETWGQGGWPEKVPAEFSNKHHGKGVLSAARTNDPNSYGGQFFICLGDANNLDGKYTAFGEVVSGMEVVDAIAAVPVDGATRPLEKIEMTIEKVK